MTKWKQGIALAAAGAILAGTAFAQGKAQESAPRATIDGKQDPAKTPELGPSEDQMKSRDQMKPMDQTKPPDQMKSMDRKSERKGMAKHEDQAIKTVQQALKGKGYDPGPIDGMMGPHTAGALKSFQKAEGLKDTGRLDPDTRQKLGLAGMSKPMS